MTGFMHEKEFSRKNFLKGSGAAVAGLSVAGIAGKASAAAPSMAGYLPDATQLDSWITVNADNTINLKMSQIETGNGITTGFLVVLAEELDTDLSQMHYGQSHYDSAGFSSNSIVDTWVVTSTGGEGGSNAMSGQGPKIRAVGVAATARRRRGASDCWNRGRARHDLVTRRSLDRVLCRRQAETARSARQRAGHA